MAKPLMPKNASSSRARTPSFQARCGESSAGFSAVTVYDTFHEDQAYISTGIEPIIAISLSA
jgi:hypothetical protein